MTAGESTTTYSWFGHRTSRRDLLRLVAPFLALLYIWWLSAMPIQPLLNLALVIYALLQLSLIFIRRRPRTTVFTSNVPTTTWIAVGIDLLFSLVLLSQAPTLGSVVYPLYILLILRALSTSRRLPLALVLPFLFGPIYVYVKQVGLFALPGLALDPIAEWGLLSGSLAIGTAAIWASALQQRLNGALRQELRTERMGREARIGDLERSANDLRSRMRQLHALEEGLRVITSTLSLDEVLNQIVDSTVQMLGSSRVHGMALSLQQGGEFDHRLFMLKSAKGYDWAVSLTRRAMLQEVPIIITDAALDGELAETIPQGMRSVLCVPLFVGDGPAEGALTVVSASASAFSSSDARHLTALSMQAGIAINNAELHNRLSQQQQLLHSVIRDINDGLVVIDTHSQVVITNPQGQALLDELSQSQPLADQLIELADRIRSEGKLTLMVEMYFKQNDDAGQFYQAYASLVRYDEHDEPLVAIVLHDITAQKLEERSRSEFISMVAHELRNPLNSLNGFIKVVLRGQAGALTALQTEFLTIADGQVELLKSRISEFLEYNRVEAGQLTLEPRWNDLSLLVAGTATRLGLQAEQNGIRLANAVEMNLPECIFDSERIGQVLNNLIENAIKATPPGGSITLRSELHQNEVWIRVCDTGVGIPKDEQDKIFQRFYRAHNRASSKGNHLGLGLTICQQIVVGHNGRIWVESEEGRGSCFSFALPLTPREVLVSQ